MSLRLSPFTSTKSSPPGPDEAGEELGSHNVPTGKPNQLSAVTEFHQVAEFKLVLNITALTKNDRRRELEFQTRQLGTRHLNQL